MSETDLTIRDNVIALMESSETRKQWNANCDRVIAANNGDYPEFWHEAIVRSGIAGAVISPPAKARGFSGRLREVL